jgi:hypothetical protein
MAYDFTTRLDYLGTRMKELHQNTMTYSRSTTDLTITNFTPERVDVQQLALMGITLVTEKVMAFVFDTSELSTLSPSVPVAGDRITIGSFVYEVMQVADEVYNYTTSTRVRIRVHCKQVT